MVLKTSSPNQMIKLTNDFSYLLLHSTIRTSVHIDNIVVYVCKTQMSNPSKC